MLLNALAFLTASLGRIEHILKLLPVAGQALFKAVNSNAKYYNYITFTKIYCKKCCNMVVFKC